ncbi:MAG: hypothetical protein GY696_32870, partial [Gammaproteobacteria bacterium]|nr:hypothetical protein [Gammaproteobacteria bacterium]
LRRHDFIAKKQSQFCSQRKNQLEDGEVLVVCDFAENYSFVLQDAAQGFHWNNAQATLHPFVVYWKEKGELKHASFIVISDCLTHDTVAVHLFQRQLMIFLEDKLERKPTKVIYFSDGAASQYKNYKNFINLCCHKEEFGCKAEWHFFATSHGKNACDGLGGTVKRLAARKSLQSPYGDQIMTAKDLFNFATSLPSIAAKFCSQKDYDEEAMYLKERILSGGTIKGTQKLHSLLPVANSKSSLCVREYSDSSEFRRVSVTGDDTSEELELEEIRGFVTVIWSGQWWLACVISVDAEFGDVKLSFLQPAGPSGSYKFPDNADIGVAPASDIISKVDPNISGRSGRSYTLSPKEKSDASRRLLKGRK